MTFSLRLFAESHLDESEKALACSINSDDFIISEAITINEYEAIFPKEFLIGLSIFSYLSGQTEQARKDINLSIKTNRPVENAYEYIHKPGYPGVHYIRIYPCLGLGILVALQKKERFKRELELDRTCFTRENK